MPQEFLQDVAQCGGRQWFCEMKRNDHELVHELVHERALTHEFGHIQELC